jgi:hypothetical protein
VSTRKSSGTILCSASRVEFTGFDLVGRVVGRFTGDGVAASSSVEKVARGGTGRKEIQERRHVHAKPGAKEH